jgi:(p)ppGpp synthase/HD superfamily hydrolase
MEICIPQIHLAGKTAAALFALSPGRCYNAGRPSDQPEPGEEEMDAYSQRYEAALSLAASAHRQQLRKGSDVPYIIHPVHVSVILIRHGFDEDVAIAGLLHDVVEDQDVPLHQIEARFGPAVAEMVAALTERKREGGAERPWETRKRQALGQIRQASLGAVAIKAADALHATRTLAADLRRKGAAVWAPFKRGPDQSSWYYHQIAEIVGQRLEGHPLAHELDRAVADFDAVIAEMGTD